MRKHGPSPGGSSFFCLLAVFFVLSCATEGPLRPAAPAALSPEEAVVEWRFFAPGVEYGKGRIMQPRLEYHVLKIDLDQDGLSIVLNGPPPEAPFGTVPAVKVSSFVRNYGLIAGINTVPFSPVSAKEGETRTIAGLVIAEGKLLSLPRPEYDALVFYKSGRAAIVNQGNLGEIENIYAAAGGFRVILENGALPGRLRRDEPDGGAQGTAQGAQGIAQGARHPRSAAGLSADGRVLYLLVIDGRRPGSAGATEAETGLILQALGAKEGLNFDGGGSSALALNFSDRRVRVVNVPIHSGLPGRERAVATCLGIGFNRQDTPATPRPES
ncbi:MAG: phosphodiester glycosidase family protein [Spirochaetaceae bacterium]|nr:phosphodiester glycosidase family protein [Spirochaetaceae bacterium]